MTLTLRRLFLCAPLLTGCFLDDIFGAGRSEFGENRDRWLEEGYASYTYRVDRSCFCFNAGLADIEVNRGTIVAVTRVDDGSAVAAEFFEIYDTVEDLFDTIENAIEGNAERLEVTYDPDLGFPTSIVLDYSSNVADDEFTFTASRMTRLP